ncbi:hypothetical protein JCM10295v2_002158 [Rhodotorula toruloides]
MRTREFIPIIIRLSPYPATHCMPKHSSTTKTSGMLRTKLGMLLSRLNNSRNRLRVIMPPLTACISPIAILQWMPSSIHVKIRQTMKRKNALSSTSSVVRIDFTLPKVPHSMRCRRLTRRRMDSIARAPNTIDTALQNLHIACERQSVITASR